MSNIHPYHGSFDPPAAALSVNLENPITNAKYPKEALALIDSGADNCTIPATIASNLGLLSVDFEEQFDFEGHSHGFKPVYKVRIIVDSTPFEVRATEVDDSLILIGRNLINNIRLLLDGPSLRFTI